MPTLAAGSSITFALGDGAVSSLASNGGFFSVTITPTVGTSPPRKYGPDPVRTVIGPFSEGATITIVSQSASVIYDGMPALGTTRYDLVTGSIVSAEGNPLTPAINLASISQAAPRGVNGNDLGLDGPMTKLSLPVPAAYRAVYGNYNDEHAYGMPIYFPLGWGGFKYWMASAVYPFTTSGNTTSITVASPGVLSVQGPPPAGTPVTLSTTGALPTGLNISTVYYVAAAGYADATCQLSLTPGGAAINTTGTQSGVHKLWYVGGQATATIATPGTIACAMPLPIGTPISFATTGSLPTGLVAGNVYFVAQAGYSSAGFQVALTAGGASIAFTGSQSGQHTFSPYAPKYENPYILVSNDGRTWVEPPGITANPISDVLTATGTDAASYYADPYIVASPDQSKLYCIWHWFIRAGTNKSTILISESADGRIWSAPVEISQSTSAGFTPNSVSLIATATGWTMVAIDTSAVAQPFIYSRTTSSTPYTGWTAPGAVYSGEWSQCNAVHPLTRKWWHQYTIPIDGGGLLSLASDNNSSGGTAWALVSWDDGTNWSVSQFSALDAATVGGNWYRPALCAMNDGGNSGLQLFASTYAWPKAPNTVAVERGPGGFQIYTARVRTDQAKDALTRAFARDALNRNLATPATLLNSGLVAWDSFNRANGAPGSLESGQAYTVASGTWAIASNQLTCSADGMIVFDCGRSSYDLEAKIVTATADTFFILAYQDSSNRMRMGISSGVPRIERVLAGGVPYTAVMPIKPASGDVMRIAKRGPMYSFYFNDRFGFSYYDPLGQNNTILGLQAAAGTVFDNLIVYAG